MIFVPVFKPIVLERESLPTKLIIKFQNKFEWKMNYIKFKSIQQNSLIYNTANLCNTIELI